MLYEVITRLGETPSRSNCGLLGAGLGLTSATTFGGGSGSVTNSCWLALRITSYNVCYTKLLRQGAGDHRRSGQPGRGRRCPPGTHAGSQLTPTRNSHGNDCQLRHLPGAVRRHVRLSRITSYNVCYMKLLRLPLLTCRLRQRAAPAAVATGHSPVPAPPTVSYNFV